MHTEFIFGGSLLLNINKTKKEINYINLDLRKEVYEDGEGGWINWYGVIFSGLFCY
jgi:hypothetical protein